MARHHYLRVRLIEPIGSGGTGTVWRTWDTGTRRYVAAKVLTSALPDEPTALDHPHVLTPYEWLAYRERQLALMRLVSGGTADRLRC
jgi:eukaryotic-like serine/threonine-protein kinase